MQQEEYGGYVIYYHVEQPRGTAFWNAIGRVDFYQGETHCSVNFTAAVNKFTSETDAVQDFMQKAKSWIDRRVS